VKIVAKQAINLVKLGHKTFVVIQQTNLNNVLSVYPELLQVKIRKLPPVPLLSKILNTVWKPFSTGKLFGSVSEYKIDFTSIFVHGAFSHLWLRNEECERLLFQTTFTPISVLNTYARSGLKKVIYLHDIPISIMMAHWKIRGNNLVKLYESWVLSKADDIACQSNYLSNVWLEEFGVKCRVIHPGCDPSPTFPYPKKDYILSIARWNTDRRPFFLIDLMKRLRDTDFKLVIGGNWPNKKLYRQFKHRISKERLQEKVTIVQNLSEQALLELYRGARCLVYPIRMTFGFPALEAAAQGTPIVYTYDSGVWEIFRPGVHGLAVVEGDIDSYVESVLKFEDNDTVKKIGHSIWKKSYEYSWDNHVAKLEKVLE